MFCVKRSYPVIIIIISFMIFGCTTEKNTVVTRTYHNVTSRYNVFYNGSESFKKGLATIEKNLSDDYSRMLPVFYFSLEKVSQMVAPDMDRAIMKATKVITLHSITAKPEMKKGIQTKKQKEFYSKKEYNKWVDVNLLLMGKSYVYKRDFFLALETFRRIISDFPGEPVIYDALIWMARVYNEIKEYRESESILLLLEKDDNLPKSLWDKVNITLADLYIKQQDYPKAIPYLEEALKYTRKKVLRLRYTYILAQLYEKNDQFELANNKYKEITKMNPPYEMTFNAKISLAGTFRAGADNAQEINSQLKKMLKDDKNKEYLDQIYFALGDLELKQDNEEEAVEYFRLSVANSIDNYNQVGFSFLKLADIYYANKDYPIAQAYYDSSLQNIAMDYENYDALKAKTSSLTGLVENLTSYQLEDSLQMLASLTDQERFVIVDKIIADLIAGEEMEREKQQEEQLDSQFGTMMAAQGTSRYSMGTEEGKWYFYNLNAKSFGQPEFRMIWGNRRLEDNWRRKNKQSLEIYEIGEQGTPDVASEEAPSRLLNTKSREYYLQNIPLTDSMMTKSHETLSKALINLGIIYRYDFKDYIKAAESFEELLKRYPDKQFTLPAYYNLYELYSSLNQPSKSQTYKNLLISKFPDSPAAKMLSDPNYLKQTKETREKELKFYDDTYILLNNSEFNAVIQNADIALNSFENSDLFPRFRLIRALAIGGLNGREALKTEMEQLAKDYPDHETGIYAREMINHIYTSSPEIEIADKRAYAEEIYSYDESATHHFAILTEASPDINQLNFNIINFNIDNFSHLNLAIHQEQFTDKTLFIIKSFDNIEIANRYYILFISNPEAFKDIDKSKLKTFLITEKNLSSLFSDKDLSKYLLFYEKYYTKK